MASKIVTGLVLLLAGSCVIAGGCGPKTELEMPEVGPLESPFSEIMPNCEDLFCDLFFESYDIHERSIYYSDGVIGHSRMIGNSFCNYYESEKRSHCVLLDMIIYNYQEEEQAIERIHEEKKKGRYDASYTEFYSEYFELPLDDIAGYDIFWKEPDVDEVQGEEGIFFRVGRYAGHYHVNIYDAPELKDGYFMPLELHDLLKVAVKITIPRLLE